MLETWAIILDTVIFTVSVVKIDYGLSDRLAIVSFDPLQPHVWFKHYIKGIRYANYAEPSKLVLNGDQSKCLLICLTNGCFQLGIFCGFFGAIECVSSPQSPLGWVLGLGIQGMFNFEIKSKWLKRRGQNNKKKNDGKQSVVELNAKWWTLNRQYE